MVVMKGQFEKPGQGPGGAASYIIRVGYVLLGRRIAPRVGGERGLHARARAVFEGGGARGEQHLIRPHEDDTAVRVVAGVTGQIALVDGLATSLARCASTLKAVAQCTVKQIP
jgi:hypothetical protein